MASRKPTAAQIRERRSRIAAVVLGVLFLGVAAIQGPKLLKMISGGSSSSAPPPAATGTTGTTPGSTTPGVAATGAGTGQLNRFSLFKVGVPFKPTVTATTTTTAKSAASAKTTTAATTTTPKAATTTTAPTTTASTTTTTPTTTAPPVTFTVPNGVPAAEVTVNGKKQLFGTGAYFPLDAPLFKLAAIEKKGLKISVVGGSFVDGQQYLVLKAGNKVTLMNQSDGTKFVIRYVKKTFAPADQLTSPTATTTVPGTSKPPATPSAPPTTTR
jgi:hypothetical protein